MRSSSSSDVVETCREVVRGWADSRVLAVFFYGSVLRGNSRSDSDLDIAVLDSAEDRISLADEARFMDSLERATGRAVDLRMLRDCSPSHQAHILREGRLIWAANSNALEEYERKFLEAHGKELDVLPGQWREFLNRLAEYTGARR